MTHGARVIAKQNKIRTKNERVEVRSRAAGARVGLQGVSGTRIVLRLEVPDLFKPLTRSGDFKVRILVDGSAKTETERAKKEITIQVHDLLQWL
jgi:hypothetical protein